MDLSLLVNGMDLASLSLIFRCVGIDFDGELDILLFLVVAADIPSHLGDFLGNLISDTIVVSVDLFSQHVAGEGLINQ